MLIKLLKYDFRLMAKPLLPLCAVILILASILSLQISNVGEMSDILTIGFTVYSALCVAIVVLTVILIVQMFYKNLLGKEGYLMFTLPVKAWQLILSKLITATVFSLIGLATGLISMKILVAGIDFSAYAFYLDVEMINIWDYPLFALTLIATMIISIIAGFLELYMAMSLGQLVPAGKNRYLASFIAFIGLQVIGMAIMTFLPTGFMVTDLSELVAINAILLLAGVQALKALILFFGTDWILRNKLNLE